MKQVLPQVSRFLSTVLAAAVTLAGTASAEPDRLERADLWSDTAGDINEAPGYEDARDSRREWVFSLGLAGGISPDYEGSNDYDTGYGPDLALSWRDIIFYKGKSLGANIIRKQHLKAGPVLAWTTGRDEDDNDRLEGLGDVDSSVEAGGFISWRAKPMRFRLEARQDIESGHEGALVELSGGATLPFDKPFVLAMLGATWASNDYMDSFFGVSSTQSANSGLQQYAAGAGIKDINISLTAGHMITRRWRVGGKIGYKRLLGDAADSPVVDDRNQYLAGISVSYHLGSKVLPEELKENY